MTPRHPCVGFPAPPERELSLQVGWQLQRRPQVSPGMRPQEAVRLGTGSPGQEKQKFWKGTEPQAGLEIQFLEGSWMAVRVRLLSEWEPLPLDSDSCCQVKGWVIGSGKGTVSWVSWIGEGFLFLFPFLVPVLALAQSQLQGSGMEVEMSPEAGAAADSSPGGKALPELGARVGAEIVAESVGSV